MKFADNAQAKKIINNFKNSWNKNISVERYLDECINEINYPSKYFSGYKFKNILEIILFNPNNKLKNIFTNIFWRLKKFNTPFYSKELHNYVVKIINKELKKIKTLDDNFFNWYTSKLSNDYKYYTIFVGYKKLNDYGIQQAYAILKDIAKFKNIKNIIHFKKEKTEAESINTFDHPENSIQEFKYLLGQIICKLKLDDLLSSGDWGDEVKLYLFLRSLSLDQIFEYSKDLHDNIVRIIKIQLKELNNQNKKFYDYYSSRLKDDYSFYYNYYDELGINKNINYRGINQTYAILKQIAEFKKVIDFDNFNI